MNESPTAPDAKDTAVFAGARAASIAVALVAGMALMLALAAYDRSRRGAIEEIATNSALGDHVHFAPSDKVPSFNGQQFQIANEPRAEISDADAHRIGHDDATGLTLYEFDGKPRKRESSPAAGTKAYYLKIADGEYLRVVPMSAGK